MFRQNELVKRGMESLLDDERLRSDLTDSAARLVFLWAELRVSGAVNHAASNMDQQGRQSSIEDSLRQIRLIIRRINDLTGARDVIDDREMREALSGLATAAGKSPPWDEIDHIVAERRRLSPEGFVVKLLELV